MKRIGYSLLIVISILTLPWYVYSALIIAGIFLFNTFYESLLWLVIIEILYGPPELAITAHTYFIAMATALVASIVIKRSIRYYD